MTSLSGKTALVLGATNPGNMGDAIARLYAAEGAKVILAGRKRAALEDLAREINVGVELCDIAEEQQVVALAEAIKANYGQLDIVANTVGVTGPIPLSEATQENLDWLMRTNFQGPLFLLKHVCPLMPSGSAVVMVTSVAAEAHKYTPTRIPYACSKASINRLVQGVAIELGQQGIQINAIAPGLVITPMGAAAMGDLGEQLEQQLKQKTPMGRLATVEDIANTALFLVQGRYFDTGQIIQVNGGFSLLDSGIVLGGNAQE